MTKRSFLLVGRTLNNDLVGAGLKSEHGLTVRAGEIAGYRDRTVGVDRCCGNASITGEEGVR